MKNHISIKHGMLPDFKEYLQRNGWKAEEPKGKYEVLRARKQGYPRPLLVHDRERGCGYSVDERDIKVYTNYRRDREKRGLDGYFSSNEERIAYWNERRA